MGTKSCGLHVCPGVSLYYFSSAFLLLAVFRSPEREREREKSPKFNVTTLSASLVSCKEKGQIFYFLKIALHSRLYLVTLRDKIDQLKGLQQLDSRARLRRVSKTQAGGEKRPTHKRARKSERERGEMTDGLVPILARVTIGFVSFDDVASDWEAIVQVTMHFLLFCLFFFFFSGGAGVGH
jgi:hypothetical protein